MKTIIGLLLLLFLVQSADGQKPAFFLIYNSNGKKVNKGLAAPPRADKAICSALTLSIASIVSATL